MIPDGFKESFSRDKRRGSIITYGIIRHFGEKFRDSGAKEKEVEMLTHCNLETGHGQGWGE